MITTANIKDLLFQLGFSQTGNVFYKHFPAGDAYLRVDFDKQELTYPEDKGLKINERQTCNFKSNENFVVFECVYRLFDKGYKPQHIELEPRWQVGHGLSGGRADILVRDNDRKALLIIECKTWGGEFDDAWKDTLNGKGQLFTYAHQERSTQYLCLYASGLEDGALKYASHIVAMRDNNDILKRKAVEKPLTYRDADSAKELYETWKRTYESDYATRGIFEQDVQPYQIGKAKYTVADLQVVTEADIQPKYHEFATILRQHNVSGRENAFDKLVNLFLCKIVDEKHNPNDLQFYWRGIAFDTYFDLIDRLQRLHRDGMREFLKEDVTYIDNQTINDAFKFFKNDPDATREKILDYFRQQKYFTNNDFSFLDVHNEQLFYQNAAILLKITRMLQDIHLNGNQQNQFLGDMFEFFLDQGFKQTEGQFFTPLPVTRFIVLSLPLETVFSDGKNPPKVIDYACGAGHFLTEMASQLRGLRQVQDVSVFYRQFYGIEKEYRLSKVAKVSAFMYNQDEINIIYADALAHHPDVSEGKFALLVSNPPYSVKGFLETLPEAERDHYGLIEIIDPKSFSTNNAIEAFFVERARQLLAPSGVAAIIMPSSILSNAASVYTRVREILLQQFDIIALVELGSGTFGKTGTNTVTLFLRRKDDNPAPADHCRIRVNAWFDNDTRKDGVFADVHFLLAYCEHIGVLLDDYKTLLQSNPSQKLLDTDIFKECRRVFENSSEVKALKKKRFFQQKSQAEQQAELDKRFIDYVRAIEREKVYYFALAYAQPCPVLVARSPQSTEEMKRFMGYEWSAAKGQEGIKYLRGAIDFIETPLFDPQNRDNPEKISTLIRQNFMGQTVSVPDALQPYATFTPLVDLLNFSRVSFDKQVSLTSKKAIAQVHSRWQMYKLSDKRIIQQIINGGTPDTAIQSYWNGNILWVTLEDMKQKNLYDTVRKINQVGLENSNATLIPENAVVLSTRATIGRVAITKKELTTNQGFKSFVCVPSALNPEYLYYFFEQHRHLLEDLVPAGTKYKEINTTTIQNFAIPIPPMDVQAQIVAACQAIDAEVEQAEGVIPKLEQEILIQVHRSSMFKRLDDLVLLVDDRIDPFIQQGDIFYVGLENIESDTGELVGNPLTDCSTIKSAKSVFKSGDILYGKLRPNLNKVYLAQQEGVCSTDILVLRMKDSRNGIYLKHYLLTEEFNRKVLATVSGQQLPRTSWEKMRNLQVRVPQENELDNVVEEITRKQALLQSTYAVIASAPARRQAVMQKYL
ncbi:type I restriction-modification system methyltransferase subunit [Longilinea arvoryzae]|uniref:Type I restriction-modification system methyltransferase subunit n=1 Tax=Longilinea arvoryzae TaxID=360412 RepID=A0A0S7BEF0_9CHLR|nr:N-6 DNA methylase [Longilinea arvoryzae]GAP12774.1 type I restriction-modification system methyltransferase subunit [Longilinea arvoryzae]